MIRNRLESCRKLLKKIYMGLACSVTVMVLGLGVTAGAETGAFTVTGGVEGTDYTYAAGVLTINTAEALTISTSGTTSDRIVVDSAAGADITLDGVDILSTSSAAMLIKSGSGGVTVTLADGSQNSLTSGTSSAAVQKDNTAQLEITGSGSLDAIGGEFGAGIGGGDGKSASNITISGGLIYAKGGKFAAGIGGGWSGSGTDITISGGCVTADSVGGASSIGGGYNGTASNIIITGGSVLAHETVYTASSKSYTCPGIGAGLTKKNTADYIDGVAVAPKYSDGRKVILLEVENPQGLDVELDGVPFVPSKHPGTDSLYFYLTAEQHTIKIGGVLIDYFYNPVTEKWTKPGNAFIITGDGLRHGTDFIYPEDTGVLTILTEKEITITNTHPDTATNNIIVVDDGVDANIILNGVNIKTGVNVVSAELTIDTSAKPAFSITDGSAADVSIKLADGSVNTLISSGAFAGLQKSGADGKLTISGSGRLRAEGGAAGIGGGSGDEAHNITISGTTVTATGGNGAGIGSGAGAAASDIEVIDSVVIATGGTNGAGIGAGGGNVSASAISIRNSVVTATGAGNAAGIGGAGSASDIIINYGSVNAVAGDGTEVKIGGSSAVVPANMMSEYVYLLMIENPEKLAVKIDGTDYAPDYHSESDTNLYVYLPADDYLISVGSTDIPYYFDTDQKIFRRPELKVTGGTLNTDYSFDRGSVTILTSTPMAIENIDKFTPTTDTIIIDAGVEAVITLNGVNIDSVGASLTVKSGAGLDLTLADGITNVLSNGISAEGDITVNGNGLLEADITTTGDVTIGSGTVTGDIIGSAVSITGNVVTGDINGATVTITGGSVTGDITASSSVTITGGSVKADSITPAPTNGTVPVYLLKIANPGNNDLYIDDAAYLPSQHSDTDSNVYAYLTGEVHSVKTNKYLTYHFDSLTSTFYLPDLNVYGDGVVYGQDYTYSNGVVRVLSIKALTIENIDPDTATSDTIVIAAGVAADVTLNGVNISSASTSALTIENGSVSVKLTLAAGSENYLTATGSGFAGLQSGAVLEMTGTGELTASGGEGAAGIKCAGDLTVEDCDINAAGGTNGAGIDGSGSITVESGSVSATNGGIASSAEVTINGGTVSASDITATNDVTVSSGTVTASGDITAANATISGTVSADNITASGDVAISSGTVTASGNITATNKATISSGKVTATEITASTVTIEAGETAATTIGGDKALIKGGSVTATTIASTSTVIDGGSVKCNDIDAAPVNSGGDAVYLLTLPNPDNKKIVIDGTESLPKQHSSVDSNVYFYLTGVSHIVKLGDDAAKTYIYDQYNKIFVVIGSDLVVTGGVYGLDYQYPVDSGVLTIRTDTAMTIANSADVSTTAHTIVIDTDVDANITLDGVSISSNGAALWADGGDIKITLKEGSENKLTSTGTSAILVEGSDSLTLNGSGTLKASGTDAITAMNAIVTLDNVVITADGGITAAGVVIDNGSVKTDSISVIPENSAGDLLYLLTIANSGNDDITINGNTYPVKQHGIDGDENVYAYLKGETQAVTIDNEETVYIFRNGRFVLPDLLITGSGIRYNTDYTYENGVLSILTEKAVTITNNPDVATTTDVIQTAAGKTAKITLNGVNINSGSAPALTVNGNTVITLAEGIANELVSTGDAVSLNGSGYAEITGNGIFTATSITGASGTVKIRGGSVTSDAITTAKAVITGGSVKAATITAPVDDNDDPVYQMVIANANNETVTINNSAYLPKQHSATDSNIYAYISGETDQTVQVGTAITKYRYSTEKNKFLIVPNADMFSVQPPASLTYDGADKEVTATPSDNTMTYTIEYYNEDGEPVTDTATAGTYTFKIIVSGDDKYAQETLTSADWKFTVKGAELPPPASVVFTAGYGYKAVDAVFDANTGAMQSANGMPVTGEWVLEYDGHFTAGGNTYTAVFTPDNKNYLSFTFTSTQVIVEAIDPVVKAVPQGPRVIPGKSVEFTFAAEHPKYPEFTEGLPTQMISVSDGTATSTDPVYTVAKDAEIDSIINITISIAGVDGKYNASTASAVITVAEKNHVDDQITVDTDNVIYGTDPEPQGVFSGTVDGDVEWSYTFAKGDVGPDANFGKLSDIYNEYGALDVGVYTVKARYEDAASIGYGVGTFRVTPKQLTVRFKGDVSKKYDGTLAVEGYTIDADDFVLSGLVGGAKRSIDTLGVTILYKDVNVGEDKELIIAIINDSHVMTEDGQEDKNYTVPDSIDFIGASIERRPVTVTAEDATKVYGEADPAFTYTVDDLVRNETLTGVLSRAEGENAGEYQITCGTLTNENNANYDITFVNAVLTITKAAAPADILLDAKHCWSAYGEQDVVITGVPMDAGSISNVEITVSDTDDIISDNVTFADSKAEYELNQNSDDKVGAAADITLILTTQNYEDITVTVSITLTDKEDQERPEIQLDFTPDADGTFTATIKAVEGAEYMFDGESWTDVNYIRGIQPNTYITAYIRMAETETHNASPAASVTKLTPMPTVMTPEFVPAPHTFVGNVTIEIICLTEGATIYYTTNGTDPTTESMVYTGPVTIYQNTTFKAIAVKDGMLDSAIATGTFTRRSNNTGGGGGGGSNQGGRPAVFYERTPTIAGLKYNWYQVAEIIEGLPVGGELEVALNGCVSIPDFVVKAIASRDAQISFRFNSFIYWLVDGAEIADAEEYEKADLNIIYPVRIMTYDVRGEAEFKFRIGETKLPANMRYDFEAENSGRFVNVYKMVDYQLIYVDTKKIGKDGCAEFSLTEKGDYVYMLSDYSDILGDVNNDGIVNALDAGALLRHIVALEDAPNIEVGDFNTDGSINAIDAGAILKWIVGAA